MPEITIKLNTVASGDGFEKTNRGLQEVTVNARGAGSEWDSFIAKLSRKFSVQDFAKDILMGFGIGSGFSVAQQVANLAIDTWKQADEYSKSIEERAKKINEEFSKIHQAVLGGSRKDASKPAALQSMADEAELLKQQYDELEAKRAKAMAGIALVGGSGGSISNWTRVSAAGAAKFGVERTASMGARDFFEEMQKRADEAQAAMAPILSRLTALRTEMQSMSKELSGETSTAAKESAKAIVEENRKIEEAVAKANKALTDAAAKYREIADPAEKYKAQIAEIQSLTHMYDSDGKVALEADVAAKAIAQLEQQIAKLAFEAKGGFAPAIRDAQNAVKAFDDAIAAVDGQHDLTDAEKLRERTRLIDLQASKIKELVASLQALAAANPGMDLGSITGTIDALNRHGTQQIEKRNPPATKEQNDIAAVRSLGDPSKHDQSGVMGLMGGLREMLVDIGTWGDTVRRTALSAAQSVRGAFATTFSEIFTKGGSFGSRMKGLWNGIYQSAANAIGQIAADWVTKHVIMSAWSALFHTKDVAMHVSGETAKTTATATGVGARILLGIKEGMVWLWQAGVKAMSALASIPYVGPVLAIAALAAVVAGGMKAMKGFSDGGHTGAGGREEPAGIVHKSEWVAPAWMVKHPIYGKWIEQLEDVRAGAGLGSGSAETGYSLGGFFRSITGWKSSGQILGSGFLPKWMLPGTESFQRKWNLLDGTSLYGEKKSNTLAYDPDTKTWVKYDLASSLTRPLTRPAQSSAVDLSATSAKQNLVVLLDSRDHNALSQLQRDPRYSVSVRRITRSDYRAQGRKVAP